MRSRACGLTWFSSSPEHRRTPTQQRNEEGDVFQVVLCASEDATEVLICALMQRQGKQGAREIRSRFKDPHSAQLLAREAGPNGVLWFEKARPPPDFQPQRDIPGRYAKLIPEAHLVQSNFYNRQPIRIGGGLTQGFTLITLSVLLCFCALLYSPLEVHTPTHHGATVHHKTQPVSVCRHQAAELWTRSHCGCGWSDSSCSACTNLLASLVSLSIKKKTTRLWSAGSCFHQNNEDPAGGSNKSDQQIPKQNGKVVIGEFLYEINSKISRFCFGPIFVS